MREFKSEQGAETDSVEERNKGFGKPSEVIGGSNPPGEQAMAAAENVKSPHAEWQACIEALSNIIRVRHYSPKTLKSYSLWIFKLRHFT